MTGRFNTDKFSEALRARAIDLSNRRILITNFNGSQQEKDFTEPANCNGFGRIRHFRLAGSGKWPPNPLPIEPARRALSLPPQEHINAQVFQNAACNWRCWYCFVDFQLLSADPHRSSFLSPSELVDLYLKDEDRPQVIDLSGGQPDLVPEWIPWMMHELQIRGLHSEVFLWSDDNLSNDYFWCFLSDADRELICNYRNYGKVCCFKGFDNQSFTFNTKAEPELFDRQFALMQRLLSLGLNIYCYATFTTPIAESIGDAMKKFVDRLQSLDRNLPLRTVPLEIRAFTPVKARRPLIPSMVFDNQYRAIEQWLKELSQRYTNDELQLNISDVRLHSHI